jgi:tryptophan halogenase
MRRVAGRQRTRRPPAQTSGFIDASNESTGSFTRAAIWRRIRRVRCGRGELELVVDRVQKIVIVGGGSTGWLAAATLSRRLSRRLHQICLIDDSPRAPQPLCQIGLPSFHRLNAILGIDEHDLVRGTCATYRLGAEFVDWGHRGSRYWHTFGSIGARLDAVPFHHHWLRLLHAGGALPLAAYSSASQAASQGRFARPIADPGSALSHYSYGYHFDSGLLAGYLAKYAQFHGVSRVERGVVEVRLRADDGFIDQLLLDDGSTLRGDLYIDCSGTLDERCRRSMSGGTVDWSQWLPCDRAVNALGCRDPELAPYSRVCADSLGWGWSTPLQHAQDCGYTYAADFVSDDEAIATLRAQIPGGMQGEPRLLQISAGRPVRFWHKNYLTLAGAALDPVEATQLHLVQTAVLRLALLFPTRRFEPENIDEYNRLSTMEYERVRDFLVLHYKATQRDDSPFWAHCRSMDVPDTLRAKIELFRHSGRLAMLEEEHFGVDSWLSVFIGQGELPGDYDPLAESLELSEVRAAFEHLRTLIQTDVGRLPLHRDYIARTCRAPLAQAARARP